MYDEKYTSYQCWARLLIGWHPASWHQRYVEEMLLILEDAPPTLKTIFNLLVHHCDAYLHQDLVKERAPFMLERLRLSALAIYGATLIFLVPWLFARAHFMDFGLHAVFLNVSLTDPFSTTITRAVSNHLLAFLLLGGVPILLATCWQALKERKWLVPPESDEPTYYRAHGGFRCRPYDSLLVFSPIEYSHGLVTLLLKAIPSVDGRDRSPLFCVRTCSS